MGFQLVVIVLTIIICLAAATHAAILTTSSRSCPKGIPQVFCFKAPCQPPGLDVCIDFPTATCKPDACFNCGNHFIDKYNNRISTLKCFCPKDRRVNCYIDPCNPLINRGCQNKEFKKKAKCEAYTCGGCFRRWFVDEVDRSFDVTSLCEAAKA